MRSAVATVLAATRAGVVRVGRSHAGWVAERDLEDRDVRALAGAGATLFAGTDGAGVWHSEDAGRSWEPAGLSGERVRSLAVGGGALYAGTRPPRVHVTRDRGRSWRPLPRFRRLRSWWWLQPAEKPFRPSYVSALAVTQHGTVVAGIEACAVLRSEDGESWSGHRRGALRDCHELHVVGDRIHEAGSGGLVFSDDDGRTWQRRRAGLDRRYGWSAAVAGETAYLTVAPYRSAHSGDSRARIVRARGDGPWQPCTDELPSLPRLAVAEDGTVFAALGDGTLLHSADGGERWEALPVGLGGRAAALLVVE